MMNLVLTSFLSSLFWYNVESVRIHEGFTHTDLMKIIIDTHEHCENYTNGCPENISEGGSSRRRRRMQSSPSHPCTNGYSASTYPCSNIDMYSHVSLYDLGGGNSLNNAPFGNDIWGWTSSSGKEYALAGLADGTSVVDISDPNNPDVIAFIKSHTSTGTYWRDMKIYENYVYIVQDGTSGHGLQYVNLDTLISRASSSSDDIYYLESSDSLNKQDNSISNCHNVFVNEDTGYLYAVGANQASGGLYIYDVSDPGNPTYAGSYADDGYTHDVQCVIYQGEDSTYVGKEICFAYNEDSVTVLDVSNKNNIVMLDREGYDNSEYTHQGWVDESHNYLYMDDELDEMELGVDTTTFVFDISNLNSISLVNNLDPYTSPTHGSIDHNHYVMGNYLYQGHYRAGVRILDISGSSSGSISEVGYFDTYVSDNAALFDGIWSVFPYFDSGVLIAQDTVKGLFVLKFNSDGGDSSGDDDDDDDDSDDDDDDDNSCGSGKYKCSSDGCCISSSYVFDGWCDCPKCEDEPNWTCDDCGGCKTCGGWKYCGNKYGPNAKTDGDGGDDNGSGSRSSSSSSNNNNDDGLDTTSIILIVVGACAVLLIVIGVVMWKRRNNGTQKKQVSLLNKSDPEYVPPQNDAAMKNDPQIDEAQNDVKVY